jgi:tetratricopeptide (TPR) repeat protein
MLDADVTEVLERIEALCSHRLLAPCGDRFDFRHDLIREVLEASVSAARRKHLHARALEALEVAAADPGELAHHAEAAGAPERALRYAIRAGDAARARWANVESVAHYERAFRIASAFPGLLEPSALDALEVRLARALTTIGRPADAERAIARAREAAESRGDDQALFEALEAQGIARQRGASAPSDALAVGERALEVARRIGEPALLSRAHTLVGSPAGSIGRIDLALEHCHAAIAEAERAGQAPKAYPMGRIALMMHFRGREDDALAWTERSEAAADVERDEESVLMARWVRALALAARGRYREAWAALDSIARIGSGEETFWHARVPNTYGAILADVGQYERALERDLESLERVRHFTARPVREVEVQTLLNLAADYLGLGRAGEARANVEAVRRQITEVEYARFRWLARLHFLDAEVAVAEGQAQRARGAADSCLVLAAEYGLPKYEVRGRIAMAKAIAAVGDRAAARKQARAAARLADKVGFAALAALAWRTAFEAGGGGADDKRRAEAAVAQAAAGLDEPMRADFLRAARIGG